MNVAGLSANGILISDPDHALPVVVNRSGLRTIAVGTGEYDRLDLPFLPNNADIRPGDLLVTSGLGGQFPAGYPVATVDSVIQLPHQPFAAVSARPKAALNQVRELMLIWAEDDGKGETEYPDVTAAADEADDTPDVSEDAVAAEAPDGG